MGSSAKIKSGTDIVNDFLKTVGAEDDIDAETLKIVQELVASESLTVTKLIQRLDLCRNEPQEVDVPAGTENDHDG